VEAEQDLQNLLSQALAIYGMKAWARDRHCCQPWDPLHQTGFALAAELESPRNMIFFLVVLINNQKIYITWRFEKTSKETCNFLGSSAMPPSKHAVFLTVQLNRQVKLQFPWPFG